MEIFTIQNLLALGLVIATFGLVIATVANVNMTKLIIKVSENQVKLQQEAFELEAFMYVGKFHGRGKTESCDHPATHIKAKKTWSDMKKEGKIDNLDTVCRAFDLLVSWTGTN